VLNVKLFVIIEAKRKQNTCSILNFIQNTKPPRLYNRSKRWLGNLPMGSCLETLTRHQKVKSFWEIKNKIIFKAWCIFKILIKFKVLKFKTFSVCMWNIVKRFIIILTAVQHDETASMSRQSVIDQVLLSCLIRLLCPNI
jgi:hypothetical protein